MDNEKILQETDSGNGSPEAEENELVGEGYTSEEIEELLTEIREINKTITDTMYIETAQVALLSFIAALLLVVIFAIVWGRH